MVRRRYSRLFALAIAVAADGWGCASAGDTASSGTPGTFSGDDGASGDGDGETEGAGDGDGGTSGDGDGDGDGTTGDGDGVVEGTSQSC